MNAERELFARYRYDGREVQNLSPRRKETRDTIRRNLTSGDYKTVTVNCPCCGTAEYTLIARKERHSLPTKVVACNNCGLIYNRERLAPEALHDFYQRHCYLLDRGDFPFDEYQKNERIKGDRLLKLLSELGLLENIGDKYVVDVGCGAGGGLSAFREQNFPVLGCELSKELVEFSNAKYGMDIMTGTIADVISRTRQQHLRVGLIIYEQVFEHLSDIGNELAQVRELMDEETLLYIGVPGVKNVSQSYNSDFLSYLEIDHLVHFSLTTLDRVLAAHGFERIYGDEIVRAIYRKAQNCPAIRSESESQTVLECIRGLEAEYRARQPSYLERMQNALACRMQGLRARVRRLAGGRHQ